jgi:ADP-ribosyl-[dinitrogen reductase] hydrolase
MIGTLIGDIIGSRFEFNNHRSEDFTLFTEKSVVTDDTILSIATADCLLHNKEYANTYQVYAQKYPNGNYGGMFSKWMYAIDPKPYGSFGNGSGMRVSPVGWFFSNLEDTLKEAEKSAAVTHNHPEGVKGAQSIAMAIFLARNGSSKEEIKSAIESKFNYALDFQLDILRSTNKFDETCQVTVPQSIYCFLISNSFEDAIRKAISIGGDSDTIACMTGGIAEAFYKEISEEILANAKKVIPLEFWEIWEEFKGRVGV